MSEQNMSDLLTGGGSRVWEVYDGDVRLRDDGTVQHRNDSDEWADGWGIWPPFAAEELPPYADPDGRTVREWLAAVEAYRSRLAEPTEGRDLAP